MEIVVHESQLLCPCKRPYYWVEETETLLETAVPVVPVPKVIFYMKRIHGAHAHCISVYFC